MYYEPRDKSYSMDIRCTKCGVVREEKVKDLLLDNCSISRQVWAIANSRPCPTCNAKLLSSILEAQEHIDNLTKEVV